MEMYSTPLLTTSLTAVCQLIENESLSGREEDLSLLAAFVEHALTLISQSSEQGSALSTPSSRQPKEEKKKSSNKSGKKGNFRKKTPKKGEK